MCGDCCFLSVSLSLSLSLFLPPASHIPCAPLAGNDQLLILCCVRVIDQCLVLEGALYGAVLY